MTQQQPIRCNTCSVRWRAVCGALSRTEIERLNAIAHHRTIPQGQAIVADLPAFYYGTAERNVRIANAILHEVADELGLEVAPLYARTRRQGGPRYALNQVAADFFHPNDRGYRVWASAFIPLLDKRVQPDGSTATDA